MRIGKNSLRAALICLTLAGAVPAVLADVLTFELEWMVDDTYFESGGWGGGNVDPGDVFGGSFTYDSSVPDTNADPYTGWYNEGVVSMVVEVGTYTLVGGSGINRLWIKNAGGGSARDEFIMTADQYVSPEGVDVDSQELTLRDSTGTVFPSDALPTTLSLDDFDWTFVYLYGWDYWGEFEVTGHLTNLVPEPGSLGLLALGMLGVVRRRR